MFYTRQALLKAILCLSHGNTYLKQCHVLHMGIFTLLSQDLHDRRSNYGPPVPCALKSNLGAFVLLKVVIAWSKWSLWHSSQPYHLEQFVRKLVIT